VTITLDDVASLLHLPITGAFHSFEPLYVDDVVFLLVEFFDAMGHMCDYLGSETYIGANVTQHSGL